MKNLINISGAYKGIVTRNQVLLNSAEKMIWIKRQDLFNSKNNDTVFFEVKSDGYFLEIRIRDNQVLLTKNSDTVVCDVFKYVDEKTEWLFFGFGWSYDKIHIAIGDKENPPQLIEKQIALSKVPYKLIQWARKQLLIPSTEYKNISEINERIFSILETIQGKINETGNLSVFYNSEKINGETIKKPKSEPDIKDIIQMMLSDVLFTSGLTLIPEKKTGVGNLDFKICGRIKNIGNHCVAVECKKDKPFNELKKGYLAQLPAYMESDHIEYGAFLVFVLNDDWYSEYSNINDRPDFKLTHSGYELKNPIFENIKIIPIDLRIKPTASRLKV